MEIAESAGLYVILQRSPAKQRLHMDVSIYLQPNGNVHICCCIWRTCRCLSVAPRPAETLTTRRSLHQPILIASQRYQRAAEEQMEIPSTQDQKFIELGCLRLTNPRNTCTPE